MGILTIIKREGDVTYRIIRPNITLPPTANVGRNTLEVLVTFAELEYPQMIGTLRKLNFLDGLTLSIIGTIEQIYMDYLPLTFYITRADASAPLKAG
jgi:hypothetical protein